MNNNDKKLNIAPLRKSKKEDLKAILKHSNEKEIP